MTSRRPRPRQANSATPWASGNRACVMSASPSAWIQSRSASIPSAVAALRVLRISFLRYTLTTGVSRVPGSLASSVNRALTSMAPSGEERLDLCPELGLGLEGIRGLDLEEHPLFVAETFHHHADGDPAERFHLFELDVHKPPPDPIHRQHRCLLTFPRGPRDERLHDRLDVLAPAAGTLDLGRRALADPQQQREDLLALPALELVLRHFGGPSDGSPEAGVIQHDRQPGLPEDLLGHAPER